MQRSDDGQQKLQELALCDWHDHLSMPPLSRSKKARNVFCTRLSVPCQQAHQLVPILFSPCLLGHDPCIHTMTKQSMTPLFYHLFVLTLLLVAVQMLDAEPWDTERHGRNTGRAWAECGELVPAYHENPRARSSGLVQQNSLRMVRQLYAPKSYVARKWSPEVRQRVRALADKLAAAPHYRDKFTRPTEDLVHGDGGT